jgi:hypothetical protein
MYDVKQAPLNIEDSIFHTVLNFFIHGLGPGSYTALMLRREFDEATRSAHPMLLFGFHDELTPHEVLKQMFIELPDFFTGRNAIDWPGYVNLSNDKRQLILDSYSAERVGEWTTYQTIGNTNQGSFREWIDLAETDLKAI